MPYCCDRSGFTVADVKAYLSKGNDVARAYSVKILRRYAEPRLNVVEVRDVVFQIYTGFDFYVGFAVVRLIGGLACGL